jgi:chromate transporter
MMVIELFLEFVLLSTVAFGGATALLPEMHRVVVENHHWLDDATFTHLYAIAQAAPGPNVLVVTLIGWEVGAGRCAGYDTGHVPADECPDLPAD